MKFLQCISELKSLKLPIDKFAIFGSGPLAVRGLKEPNDFDIIVKKDLWDILDRKIMMRDNEGGIVVGDICIEKDWQPWFDDVDKLIDEADMIGGFRFVKLERVLEWKKAMNREKDQKDIQLLEECIKKEKTTNQQ